MALVGGVGRFAEMLERDVKAIYAWRSRYNGHFPRYMTPRVTAALEECGYSIPGDFLAQSDATFRIVGGEIVASPLNKNILPTERAQ